MSYEDLATLTGEPTFPEEIDGLPRRLDFYAQAIPPLARELRRELALHFARLGIAPAWYVPRPIVSTPYAHFRHSREAADLPRLIADAGPRHFCHPEFRQRWPSDSTFAPLPAAPVRPEFERAGLTDPEGLFHVHGAASFGILADLERLGDRPLPTSWADVLHPRFRGDIVVNGTGGDPAPILLANLARDFGAHQLRAFGRNIKSIQGGGEMARAAGSRHPDRSALYLMPWFWTQTNIHHARTRPIWPVEGLYCTPLLLLGRPELTPGARAAFDFVTGPRWAERVEGVHCAVADPRHARTPIPGELRWIGWDLARDSRLDSLIADARAHCREGYRP